MTAPLSTTSSQNSTSSHLLSNDLAAFAQRLVQRRLGTATIFALEAFKPMSVVAHQSLMVTSPLAQLAGWGKLFNNLCQLFESRQTMEELVLEVERLLEVPHGN